MTPFASLAAGWADLPLTRKGLFVVTIPLGALLLAFALLYVVNLRQTGAESWLRHTLEVRAEVRSIFTGMLDAETGVRGYVISHRDEFLDRLEFAQKTVPASVNHLARLVSDNPAQLRHVAELKSLVQQRFEILGTLVRAARSSAMPDAKQQNLVDQGKGTTDQLRHHIEEMDRVEARLQTERGSYLDQIRDVSLAISASAVIFGLLGGLLSMLLFSRGIVRRVQCIEENADRLSRELPLLPVQRGNDEIGRLATRLEAASALLAERSGALRSEANRLEAEAIERQRAEAELRDSQRELEAVAHANELIMKNSRDVICTIDEAGRFLSVSAACGEMWGYAVVELAGHAYIDFVYPEDRPKTNAAAVSIIAGSPLTNFENRYVRKDGSLVSVMWSAYWSPPDRVMFCVAHDITARQRAAQELEEAKVEADRANRAKSEFLSRMSHELRTPLNAILGFAQILEMDSPGEREKESVGHILRAGRHLLDLINEVLDLARIEAGRLSISTEAVLLSDVLEQCVQLIRPLAQQRRVTIDTNYGEHCDRHVLADRQRLTQVMLNLLSNAVKYNRDAGTVTISCVEVGAALRIDVSDTGYGVTPEERQRLFSAFERLQADRTGIEGTGLGLALSKRLMELMGGKIGVESTPGTGSRFWVELPFTESPVARLPSLSEGAVSLAESTDARTILYIEDNLSNLRLIERIFEGRPAIKLIAAMQGGLGLELAREHGPDLILLDLNLPDMSGHDVLRRLKGESASSSIPVVVISADATQGQIERVFAAGADAYLVKPLELRKFLTTVDDLLAVSP